jgi:F0F1-type ATP synthase membrane subunit b/b'
MEQALDFNLVLGIVFGLLGVFLLILWIAVPFVVFGIRKRLDDTNRHLKEILARRPE